MPLLIAYQNSSPILLRRRQHRTQELLTLPPSENLINYNLDYTTTTLTSARATTAAATSRQPGSRCRAVPFPQRKWSEMHMLIGLDGRRTDR
jgi:hypothetical protein